MAARNVLIGVDVGGTFTDAVVIVGAERHRAKSPSTYPEIGNGVLAACKLAAEAAGRYLADEAQVESIAVSFLWSFLNQDHEREAARLLRESLPGMPVSAGVELRPVIREYERTTLAVLNAYAKGAYRGVDRLAETLRDAGLTAPVLLCHSGGGAISIDQAREQPVWLSASGPAAGVAAAARIAADAGEDKVLTCDLGGTSFDVAHLADGAPARTQRGDLMGFWTALPRVDVELVGAGGGSLAWVDERGMLRVGPRSAGSSPGPVCYGRGGTQVALTDALLVLGYIDPARFLGGAMVLDRAAALAACARLGEQLGLDAVDTAWGVREIAVAEMVKAVRARLSNHALAASEHCLVSYGGCGALFAAEVARLAGLRRVLVPELASVLSAFGAATMDIRRERLATLLMKLPGEAGAIDRTFAELRNAVWQDLSADGMPEADREVRFEVDMRWLLQRWELTLAIPGQPASGDGGAQVEALFRAEYLRRFGAASVTTSGIVELVGIRAVGIGRMEGEILPFRGGEPAQLVEGQAPSSVASRSQAPPPVPLHPPLRGRSPSPFGGGSRPVSLKRSAPETAIPVHDLPALTPGDTFAGPALIDSPDTTIWVPQGMTARLDASRTLVIEVQT